MGYAQDAVDGETDVRATAAVATEVRETSPSPEKTVEKTAAADTDTDTGYEAGDRAAADREKQAAKKDNDDDDDDKRFIPVVSDLVPDITEVTVAKTAPIEQSEVVPVAAQEQQNKADHQSERHARNEERAEGVDPTAPTAVTVVDSKMDSDNSASFAQLVAEQQAILTQAAADVQTALNESNQVSDLAEPMRRYLDAQAAVNQLENPGAEEEYALVQLAEQSSEIAGIPFPYRAAGTIPGLSEEQTEKAQSWLQTALNSEVLQQLVPGTIGNVTLIKFSDYIADVALSKIPQPFQVMAQIGVGAVTGRTTALGIREVTDAGFEALGADIAREMPGVEDTFKSENWGQLLVDSVVSTTAGVATSNAVKAVGLYALGLSTGPVGLAALAAGSYAASKGFVWADNKQDELWDDISRTTAENIAADLGIVIDGDPLSHTDAQEAELVMFYGQQPTRTPADYGEVMVQMPTKVAPDKDKPMVDPTVLSQTEETPVEEAPVRIAADAGQIMVDPAKYPTPSDSNEPETPVAEDTAVSDAMVAMINSWLDGSDTADSIVLVVDNDNDNDDRPTVPEVSHDCDVTGSVGMMMFEDLLEGRVALDDVLPEVQTAFELYTLADIDLVNAAGELQLHLADPFIQELVDSGQLDEYGSFCDPAETSADSGLLASLLQPDTLLFNYDLA